MASDTTGNMLVHEIYGHADFVRAMICTTTAVVQLCSCRRDEASRISARRLLFFLELNLVSAMSRVAHAVEVARVRRLFLARPAF